MQSIYLGMCGIVGALSHAPIPGDVILQMRDRLSHRGPDSAGSWSSSDLRVQLGHRRLAVIDLSAESNQPFKSRDGRFVVIFNGEIYNYKDLRRELQRSQSRFYTNSDTEVLLESFRKWREGCVSHLSGMFAFALWDEREKTLFCARDRVGEKPFYYTLKNGSFVFASELKALLLWPGLRAEIDYPALVDFFTLGFVADPKSIWKDCYKLPPGHSMTVQLTSEGPRIRQGISAYWDWEFSPDYSVSDWGPSILETLQIASKEMTVADVPIGTFLSGGVDSSSVTAALGRSGCNVRTFTIGFDEPEFDERDWARQIAELYGTSHTEKKMVTADLPADFEQMLWHYDEPFNDYSYLPTFHVCREARKSVTVALSGDGGDEVFAGYRKYQRLALRQKIGWLIPRSLSGCLVTGVTAAFSETSRLRRTLLQYCMATPDMMLDALSLVFPYKALRSVASGPLAETIKHYSPMDVVAPLMRKAPPEEVGPINAMRYLDLKLTLAGDILVKVDRASMAVSLEVRPVYLHREVLDLARRIPPGLLADRRHSKKALKRALQPWLPESLLYRRKKGFAMPLKHWIDGDLRQIFTDRSTRNPIDDLFHPALLRGLMEKHFSGATDMTPVLHGIFFLRNWMAKWL